MSTDGRPPRVEPSDSTRGGRVAYFLTVTLTDPVATT